MTLFFNYVSMSGVLWEKQRGERERAHEFTPLYSSEEGIGSLSTELTNGCELSGFDVGKQTGFLQESRKCS